MPPKRGVPMIGEQQLDGMPAPQRRMLDPKAPNAFARFATPAYMGLDARNYEDLTEGMIATADPDNLRKRLLNVSSEKAGEFVQGYVDDNGNYTRVVITPGEYQKLARSPKSIKATASASVLVRSITSEPLIDPYAKSDRAAVHRLERLQEGMSRYMVTLVSDKAVIDRIAEAAEHPGYQRGSEMQFRSDTNWLMQRVVGNMFEALRHQRKWTPEQYSQAERSLQWRLFFMRSRNQHIYEWSKLLGLLGDYNAGVKGLFASRMAETEYKIQSLS